MTTDPLAFSLPEDFTVSRSSAQLINQDSGNVEYYTDPKILAAAREVMGWIDLDPASTAEANVFVQAEEFLNKEMDGLKIPWHGNVWLNHPFSREENAYWISRLVNQYESGNTRQSLNITFAATSEKWFQPLAQHPQCYLSPRTNYFLPDGTKKTGVTKGSVVTYIGPNWNDFYRVFRTFGICKAEMSWLW